MSGIAIYLEGGGDGRDAKAALRQGVNALLRGSERTSVRVKQAADRVVGWNTESIVSAIRELA